MPAPPKPALGMILKGFPRISETFISNEILLLEKMDRRVHIFSMRAPREAFTHASVKNIQARVDYLPEKLFSNLGPLLAANAALYKKNPGQYARGARLLIHRYQKSRKTASLRHFLQAGYLLDRFFPGTGVVHFHAHFAHSPTSVAQFAAALSGLPFSFFAHAKDVYTQKRESLVEKIRAAQFLVTCTGLNREYLQYLAHGESTPIHRVYHGIDLSLFSRESMGTQTPEAPFQLLTVARMTPKKGLVDVFEALAILNRKGFPFSHTLVGSGEDEREVTALMEKMGLSGKVRLTGTLPHEEVVKLYRTADAFVLGCRVAKNGDRDGIPNVLVEAMAMGVPVVVPGVSAIPELVSGGKTGMLARPRAPQTLADAVEQLCKDAQLRKKIIPAARLKVEADFDNAKNIQTLAEIYARAADRAAKNLERAAS